MQADTWIWTNIWILIITYLAVLTWAFLRLLWWMFADIRGQHMKGRRKGGKGGESAQ